MPRSRIAPSKGPEWCNFRPQLGVLGASRIILWWVSFSLSWLHWRFSTWPKRFMLKVLPHFPRFGPGWLFGCIDQRGLQPGAMRIRWQRAFTHQRLSVPPPPATFEKTWCTEKTCGHSGGENIISKYFGTSYDSTCNDPEVDRLQHIFM